MKLFLAFLFSLGVALSVKSSIIAAEKPAQNRLEHAESSTLFAAIKYYESGRIDVAHEILLKILQTTPTDKKALYYLHLVDQAKNARQAKPTEPFDPQWKAPQPAPRYLI